MYKGIPYSFSLERVESIFQGLYHCPGFISIAHCCFNQSCKHFFRVNFFGNEFLKQCCTPVFHENGLCPVKFLVESLRFEIIRSRRNPSLKLSWMSLLKRRTNKIHTLILSLVNIVLHVYNCLLTHPYYLFNFLSFSYELLWYLKFSWFVYAGDVFQYDQYDLILCNCIRNDFLN